MASQILTRAVLHGVFKKTERKTTMWMGYTDWLSAPRIAAELDMDVKKVREWKSRKHDPLPVKYIGDNRKQWRVYRKELDAWLVRNEYLPPSPNA